MYFDPYPTSQYRKAYQSTYSLLPPVHAIPSRTKNTVSLSHLIPSSHTLPVRSYCPVPTGHTAPLSVSRVAHPPKKKPQLKHSHAMLQTLTCLEIKQQKRVRKSSHGI